ncbi:HEXXH motif domain-containing protein [Actinomadura chibensis]|nr:HEXXH motif domain-containing protein [Actinomadura chibensis]
MRWPTHSISVRDFSALAAGGGGAAVVRALGDVEYSRNVLLVAAVADTARRAGHPGAERIGRDLHRLLGLLERVPDAARPVLGHPSVGVWALRTLRALRDPGPAGAAAPDDDPSQLGALVAAVAVRARIPGAYRVAVRDGAVTLPSVGRALLDDRAVRATVRVPDDEPGIAARVHTERRRVDVPDPTGTTAPGWEGLRPLADDPFPVLLDDTDPYRFPPGIKLAPRLDAETLAELRDSYAAALRLLDRGHPAVAAEAGALISTVTPLVADAFGLASATSREAFGCVATSVTADPRQLAVTLVHEMQHAKLAALMDTVSLLPETSGPPRFYAPWRPDPRALPALLHGTYAFLGVTGFWYRQRHHERGRSAFEAQVEFARWRAAVRVGLDQLLAEPALPPLGARFVRGMRDTLALWSRARVPHAACQTAARLLADHRSAWTLANGSLPRRVADAAGLVCEAESLR